MRRSVLILLGGVVLMGGLFYATQKATSHFCRAHWARPADDLEWLRTEFRLSEVELAAIRKLHEGYLPQCRQYCDRIAQAKTELHTMLLTNARISPAVEQKLAEIAALRAQCQAGMLRHFIEVSQMMPAPQGKRYLAEMHKLTLEAHEQVERSMSTVSNASHGHQ